jgi:hypothetical protein
LAPQGAVIASEAKQSRTAVSYLDASSLRFSQ